MPVSVVVTLPALRLVALAPFGSRRPASQPAPPVIAPEDARRAADDVLSRPAYREPEPSLIERALERIGEFLARSFASLTGSGPGSPVATVVLVALVVGAAWFLYRAIRTRSGRRRAAEGPLVTATTEAVTDAATWRAEAARLTASGDLRGALRCHHQAAVATLVERDVVARVPGRTPAELADALVALAPDRADDVTALTEAFEAVWYGGIDVDDAALADAVARAERVAALDPEVVPA